MKWMLLVMVFGNQPVETDLIFDGVRACYRAIPGIRSEQSALYVDLLQGSSSITFDRREEWDRQARAETGKLHRYTCIPYTKGD